MATRSRLKVDLPGEEPKSIYCHYDGHPENQLPILNTYYNTPEKAKELISLGDISYLGKRLEPDPGEIHTFANPAKDVTLAYHRDGKQKLRFNPWPQMYNYVFDGDTWELE